MKKNNKVLFLVLFAVLVGIEAVFCFTPLGSIAFTPVVVATLAMIPILITALLLGPGAGTAMGVLGGLFSLIVWTFMPGNPAMAFIFTPFYSLGEIHGNFGSLLICFVPRILVGTVAGLSYKGLSKLMPKMDIVSMSIASIAGSLVNTFGVVLGMRLFFGAEISSLMGGTAIFAVLSGIVLTNGIPEAIVSAVLVPAACKPLKIIINEL